MTERFSSSALGFVCIVGAGPSPLDLMTLRALNRLRNADVVVHDRLVSTEVLDQIPPQTQRVYVGNALGDHSVPQEGIHALLVEHAQRARRVTSRRYLPEIIALANNVTKMTIVKHAFKAGVPAQRGIED